MNSSNFYPLVSIVVPCYNSGLTLERTVSSLANQTHQNVEIIVVDDGSSDDKTLSKLRNLEGLYGFRLIRHRKNFGLPSARNTGFGVAKGEFVLFLDADDWISDDALEIMLQYVPDSSTDFFLYFDIIFHGDRQGISTRYFKPFSQLAINKIPYCILLRRDSIKSGKPYDEQLISGLEDWSLNLRLLEEGFKPIKVEGKIFHYEVNPHGMFRQTTQRKYFTVWSQIQKSRPALYSFKYLLKSFKEELSQSSISKVALPACLILISKLHIPKTLDLLFDLLMKLRAKRSTVGSKSFC